MKNITLISLLCLLLFSPKLLAQEEMQISKNAVELDLLSFDRLYNFNYERAFVMKKWAIIPKIGIYIHPYSGRQRYQYLIGQGEETNLISKSFNSVNLGLDFVYGREKHFLRFGINTMAEGGYLRAERGVGKPSSVLNYAIQPAVGYRFQKNKKGLFLTSTIRPFYISIDALRNRAGDKVRDYNYESRGFPVMFIPSIGIGYSF